MRRQSSPFGVFTDLPFNSLLDVKAESLIAPAWPDGRREDVDLRVEDP